MEYQSSSEQVRIPEGVKPIGNVLIDFTNGITLKWLQQQGRNIPPVVEGDEFILAFRDNPILVIKIGPYNNFEEPLIITPVQNPNRPLVTPDKDAPVILRVFPVPKQTSSR